MRKREPATRGAKNISSRARKRATFPHAHIESRGERPYRLLYDRLELIYARRYPYPLTPSFGRRLGAVFEVGHLRGGKTCATTT